MVIGLQALRPPNSQGFGYRSLGSYAVKFTRTWLEVFRLSFHQVYKELVAGLKALMPSSSYRFCYRCSGSYTIKFI